MKKISDRFIWTWVLMECVVIVYTFCSTSSLAPTFFNAVSADLWWLRGLFDLGRSEPWAKFVGPPVDATLDLLGAAAGFMGIFSLPMILLVALIVRAKAGPGRVFDPKLYGEMIQENRPGNFGVRAPKNWWVRQGIFILIIALGVRFIFLGYFSNEFILTKNNIDLTINVIGISTGPVAVAASLYGFILAVRFKFTKGN